MKAYVLLPLIFALLSNPVRGQESPPVSAGSAADVVEQLWRMAMQGALLTPGGWQKASALYADSGAWPGSSAAIRIVSNYWETPEQGEVQDREVKVLVWFRGEVGQIDCSLRYTPAKVSDSDHAAAVYRLAIVPTHTLMYGPDGKTLVGDRLGPGKWRILGSPRVKWTTVNTAICYLLEMRGRTREPSVKENADKAVAALLQLR